ncbi:hypothetical protein MRX96_026268 [Rhipicephalus microplus]
MRGCQQKMRVMMLPETEEQAPYISKGADPIPGASFFAFFSTSFRSCGPRTMPSLPHHLELIEVTPRLLGQLGT